MTRRKHDRTSSQLPSATTADEIIALMEGREVRRDVELHRLEEEASRLQDRLRAIEDAKLAEELACFRDVLALHRRARTASRSR